MSGTNKKPGEYYEPTPLDFELLSRMPEEGTTLGFHNLGLTVGHAKRELNKTVPEEAKLSSDIISSRIRAMHVAEMVARVKLFGAEGAGWQRTAKGTAYYEEKTGKKLSKQQTLALVQGGTN